MRPRSDCHGPVRRLDAQTLPTSRAFQAFGRLPAFVIRWHCVFHSHMPHTCSTDAATDHPSGTDLVYVADNELDAAALSHQFGPYVQLRKPTAGELLVHVEEI